MVPNTLSSLQEPSIYWHLKIALFGPVSLVAALSISFSAGLIFFDRNILEDNIFQMSYNTYFYVTQRDHSNQIKNTTPKRIFNILLLIWQSIKHFIHHIEAKKIAHLLIPIILASLQDLRFCGTYKKAYFLFWACRASWAKRLSLLSIIKVRYNRQVQVKPCAYILKELGIELVRATYYHCPLARNYYARFFDHFERKSYAGRMTLSCVRKEIFPLVKVRNHAYI